MSDLTTRALALFKSAGSAVAAQAVCTTNIAATTDSQQAEWRCVFQLLNYDPATTNSSN